ncbi:type II toxin-antitoxin system PemK/MazF family toxin [Desulfosporosinus sp. FKA]|uniref:type II toxin-antitoxin system PemK/MazF family toxin n=1 Tax=Desulfosporosinus sp. FKA TaxID=1969834 RepID=UPI00112500FC|nr:type II toxin-antitoxin system PemK/MazF family toxin [Desulfosporosinus sp. FKA]
MTARYLNSDHWSEISRGHMFEAVIYYPSDTKRPLTFFIPDEDNKNRGSVISSIGDFKAKEINGRKRAVVQQAIVGMKPRKVLILSNDEFNASTDFEFVQVAPIMSIDDKDKSKQWYLLTKNDEHPAFVYLSEEITGRECYIDISEIMSIHKSMLLSKIKCLPVDRIKVVEDNILECLDLGFIEDQQDISVSDKVI